MTLRDLLHVAWRRKTLLLLTAGGSMPPSEPR
jgi:hypothetical protein